MRYIEREGFSVDSIENLIEKQKKNNTVDYSGAPSRRHLFQAYGTKCCYCEAFITNFEVEHRWPQIEPKKLVFYLKNLKIDYNKVVNDVRNWHLACSRCNKKKDDFLGRVLSPNYYFSIRKNSWQKVNDRFIEKNIWYDGAYACYSNRFKKFFDKLELNGKISSRNTQIANANAATCSAILQWRIEYLEETKQLLLLLEKLTLHGTINDAKILFEIIRKRFVRSAPFSRMIQRNCFKAYFGCIKELINKNVQIDIDKIKSQV